MTDSISAGRSLSLGVTCGVERTFILRGGSNLLENPHDEMFRFVCIRLRLEPSAGVKCGGGSSKQKGRNGKCSEPVAAHGMFHVGVGLTRVRLCQKNNVAE